MPRKKRRNKQTTPHAASFKRVAKGVRGLARIVNSLTPQQFVKKLAQVFDGEAKRLRSMR